MSIIDTLFVASNFDEKRQVENPDRFMCRYEFYEIIPRIAEKKYLDSNICKTLPEAVEMVLKENLLKHFDSIIPWHEWRVDHLWNINIDDLYFANMSSLVTLYKVNSISNRIDFLS